MSRFQNSADSVRSAARPWSQLARWLLSAVGLVGLAGFIAFSLATRQKIDRPAAVESLLVLGSDHQAVEAVERQRQPELLFQVRLKDAPIGRRLWLACDWVGPDGRVWHQSQYHSSPIESGDATTQTAYTLPPDAPLGQWTVRLALHGTPLAERQFEVR